MLRPIFRFALTLTLAAAISNSGALADVLKGRVQEEGKVKNNVPSLTRTDIDKAGDPFGGSPADMPPMTDDNPGSLLDAPKDAFKFDVPKNSKKFGLNANKDDFSGLPILGSPGSGTERRGSPMKGQPDALMSGNPAGQSNIPIKPNPGQQKLGGPEDSEADLGWDEWHRRVAAAIFQKWNMMCSQAFAHNPFPMQAYVSYTVTKDGEVKNAQLLRKSPNPIYNALVLEVINSFNGDTQLLHFPEGSRRISIEKFGEFDQNNGVGAAYRYTTGDKEHYRIPGVRSN